MGWRLLSIKRRGEVVTEYLKKKKTGGVDGNSSQE